MKFQNKYFPLLAAFILAALISLFVLARSTAQGGMERKALDKVKSIPEVKERAKYLAGRSKRRLQYIVWQKPKNQIKYYWIKVMEDNGETYYPRFSFRVFPPKLSIQYLDPSTDSVIDYKDWKKGQKN
jgi:hypothetical protein